MRKKEKERGKVSGSRVISLSQHRPLNSTPLVETKSDTRKAKLLQMHKPFSIRPPLYPLPLPLSSVSLLPIRSLQPPDRPPRFPPPLSTLAPFSYPLILSQPFSLRKRRSAIHLSSSSSFLFLLFPLSFSLYFSFLCVVQGCSIALLAFSFFLPSSTSEKPPAPGFFSITLFPIEHCPSRSFSEGNCSTSGYLIPLINSWRKSLRFGLFHGTRPSLETTKMKWSSSIFTFVNRSSILIYKASSKLNR